MTQHAFFDLDGTLTDPALGIVRCLQHALHAVSGPTWADADLKGFIGPPLHEVFRTLLRSDDHDFVARAIGAYRERFGTLGLYENAVYPQIPEVLAQLQRAGFRLWVVTSKATVYADRIVDHFLLRPFFARVHGAELSGERSVKTELLAHVLQTERIDPGSAYMIGDRKHDIEGAKAHGIASLGVLWGYGSRAELELAGATVLVPTVADVPAMLQQLSGATHNRCP